MPDGLTVHFWDRTSGSKNIKWRQSFQKDKFVVLEGISSLDRGISTLNYTEHIHAMIKVNGAEQEEEEELDHWFPVFHKEIQIAVKLHVRNKACAKNRTKDSTVNAII